MGGNEGHSLLETLRQRLPFVLLILLLVSLVLMLRLTVLAIGGLSEPDMVFFDAQRAALYKTTLHFEGERGAILDRSGEVLAVNHPVCTVAINPPLITRPLETARALAPFLESSTREIYDIATGDQLWQSLVNPLSPLSGKKCQQLDELDLYGIEVDRLQRRNYPQSDLAAHVIGFINFDDSRPSGFGVEGYYHSLLSGKPSEATVSADVYEIPLERENAFRGHDLVLTIDRDLQFLAEQHLAGALQISKAIAGTIIVMDVETGAVRAMANLPNYDPNRFYEVEEPNTLANAAISGNYEPGAVIIPMILAGALDEGFIDHNWRYVDKGELIFGGVRVLNDDRLAFGEMSAEDILIRASHIGAAHVAIEMGTKAFYDLLKTFGLGRNTEIDLAGESPGQLPLPGQSEWSDTHLVHNAYGQALEVTPLQLAAAYAAIANQGRMMQPHVVAEVLDNSDETGPIRQRPNTLTQGVRILSAQTANLILEWLERKIQLDFAGELVSAEHSLAGMLTSAAIPDLTGYRGDEVTLTFLGITPVTEPELLILLKLDEPQNDETLDRIMMSIIQGLLNEIFVLMELPPDSLHQSTARSS